MDLPAATGAPPEWRPKAEILKEAKEGGYNEEELPVRLRKTGMA